MKAFELLPAEIDHFISTLLSQTLYGNDLIGITQYHFYLLLGIILLFIFVFTGVKRMELVPKGMFVNIFESIFEYIRNSVVYDVLGPSGKKHLPFLMTLFFFILINNLIGMIPGMKPGTGTIGVAGALAIISFIYFIVVGVKSHGAFGYLKSLAPKGLNPIIAFVIWLIEVFSTALRLVTLAIRLFANLFAGHIVIAAFALLTSMFFMPLLQEFTLSNLVGAIPSIAWLAILTAIWLLEIVVAMIQAFVFTILSAVYINLAEETH